MLIEEEKSDLLKITEDINLISSEMIGRKLRNNENFDEQDFTTNDSTKALMSYIKSFETKQKKVVAKLIYMAQHENDENIKYLKAKAKPIMNPNSNLISSNILLGGMLLQISKTMTSNAVSCAAAAIITTGGILCAIPGAQPLGISLIAIGTLIIAAVSTYKYLKKNNNVAPQEESTIDYHP